MDPEKYQCNCGKSYKLFYHFSRHIRTPQISYICPHCHTSIADYSYYKEAPLGMMTSDPAQVRSNINDFFISKKNSWKLSKNQYHNMCA